MKVMKRMVMAVCIIGMFFIGGQAIAGNGNGSGSGSNAGQNSGTSMYVDICAGDEIIIAGTIVNADLYSGQGIDIDTGDEVVTVYGFGPIRFWDSLEVARPAIGDNVIIDARGVTFSDGTIKNLAVSITFVLSDNEENITIELRDEDCLPGWRGSNKAE